MATYSQEAFDTQSPPRIGLVDFTYLLSDMKLRFVVLAFCPGAYR